MKARNDFAGVRGQTARVEFTVYGLECSVHEDPESAQYFNLGKHLLQLNSEPEVKVDRYDVRLLVDEGSRASDVEPGQEAEDFDQQELEDERYQDLREAEDGKESPIEQTAPDEGMQLQARLPVISLTTWISHILVWLCRHVNGSASKIQSSTVGCSSIFGCGIQLCH